VGIDKGKSYKNMIEREKRKTGKLLWQTILLLVALALFRILYVDIYESLITATHFSLVEATLAFFSNYWALILSVGLDVLVLFILHRYVPYGIMPFRRIAVYFVGVMVSSVVATLVIHAKLLFFEPVTRASNYMVLGTFITVVLFNLLVLLFADLLVYFKRTKKEVQIQSGKKHKVQYQYQQLKSQLNPHFLFNSLNVLDYLVQNDEKQRASDYIKKLAGVYRYLLNMGEYKIVRLEEEISFVKLYVDLIKERFIDGLEVCIEVPQQYMDKYIIPCGIQTLVENATKHNVVNAKSPLRIRIYIDEKEEKIAVENNLQLRLNAQSTGVGLKNINKQYEDIAGKKIDVLPSENTFLVKLPLMQAVKNNVNIGAFEENTVSLSAKSI